MSHSVRVFYSGIYGTEVYNHNWPPINKKSAVLVTASEFHWPGGLAGLEAVRPKIGAARVWVSSIAVHGPEGGPGGVEFRLHVEWDSPINVMVTITVLDDIEVYTRID